MRIGGDILRGIEHLRLRVGLKNGQRPEMRVHNPDKRHAGIEVLVDSLHGSAAERDNARVEQRESALHHEKRIEHGPA